MIDSKNESVREFRIDYRVYRRHAIRKSALSLMAALTIAVALLSPSWPTAFPLWLRVSIAIIAIAVVAIGLIALPLALGTVRRIRVRLGGDAISYYSDDSMETIAYRDASIVRVRYTDDSVSAVVLAASDGRTMDLRGFEQMNQLHSELQSRLSQNNAKGDLR